MITIPIISLIYIFTDMDVRQISTMLSHIPDFLGVFACDTLPHNPPSNFSLVVNTDSSDKAGIHWQAIIVRNNVAFFFDSFGNIPRVRAISRFCKQFHTVHYNKKKHQRMSEVTCGAYCVYVINEMSKGRSFNSVLSTFKRIKRDDLFVRKYLLINFSFHL